MKLTLKVKRFYCVEMLSIDTSAERKKYEVNPKYLALKLRKDILTSF